MSSGLSVRSNLILQWVMPSWRLLSRLSLVSVRYQSPNCTVESPKFFSSIQSLSSRSSSSMVRSFEASDRAEDLERARTHLAP